MHKAILLLGLLCFAQSAFAQSDSLSYEDQKSNPSADGTPSLAACTPPVAAGPTAIAGTFGGSSEFYKPNQSKVFFHDEKWWVAAPDNANNGWFLWRKSSTSWTKMIRLSEVGSVVPDCYLDAANHKLYILLAHTSADGPHFLRLTYNKNTDAWSMDTGFPVALVGFTHQGENPSVLVRAKNGDFWIFVTRLAKLFARRSKDGGATWTGDILVKNLGTHTVMCDAVSFTSNGVNYVGVGYGEDTDPLSKYGFLKHKDGDANNEWSDETSKVKVPPRTYADDHIAMMVAPNNALYMVVKTNPDDQSSTGIALYKRTPAGVWSTHTVFISSAETRPALAIDETNNELYVFTTLLGSPRYGRFRKCALGQEDSLATAATKNYFKVATDNFHNVSTPPHYVNSCSGLLVAAENDTKSNTWYQLFAIKGGTPPKPAVTIGPLTITPTTKAQAASYKIPITLGANFGLTGGTSTITITWPSDTEIPSSIANSAVTVNGVNAASVTTAPANRRATVKVPNNLAGGALVNLLFKAAAGISNPAAAGNYTLQARTSAQTTDATSPSYNISGGGTLPPTGAPLASSTNAAFDKSSQSKVFYLENKWWTMAQDATDSKWYLWSFNGASWARGKLVDERPGARADMIVDATNKRLFVLGSQTSSAIFFRFVYASSVWTQEKQVTLTNFGHGTGANVVTMTRAKNNALWVFRINNNVLETQVSKDNGNTWSATIPLKTGLPGVKGQTEAVAFSASGNYVGVFYSLINTNTGKLFGFMKHLDSDINSKWTDETSAIARFGTETPEGSLCAAVNTSGVVYVLTRTNPNGPDDPNNTLYKRSAAGTWSKFIVNVGYDWSSPALAIDASNNRLYLMGIRMNSTPNVGEYVSVAIGQESTIVDAFATVFMKNAAHNFANLSAPATPATSANGLMMLAGNTTADEVWFSRIDLGLPKAAEEEVVAAPQQETEIDKFEAASVYPNPFNPSTTIRFAVKEPTNVKLQIFNLRGELVRTLANGEHVRGVYEKLWNGRDQMGNLSASGVYFYRLRIGEQLYRGRMQMVK